MMILNLFTDGIGGHEEFLITNHYALAAFGWFVYMVGKLWYYRDKYDTNNNGLGLKEVGVFFRMNWIAFFFAALLAFILVPFAPNLWNWTTDSFEVSKDWPVTDLVYLLVGGIILGLQLIIDWIKRKKG